MAMFAAAPPKPTLGQGSNPPDPAQDAATAAAQTTATNIQPPSQSDTAAIERIRDLGTVGTALFELSNGRNFETNIYAAREALKRFVEGIQRLGLEPQLQKGMDDLAAMLSKMLDERLKDTFETPQQNF